VLLEGLYKLKIYYGLFKTRTRGFPACGKCLSYLHYIVPQNNQVKKGNFPTLQITRPNVVSSGSPTLYMVAELSFEMLKGICQIIWRHIPDERSLNLQGNCDHI
jgi:hypothetical protein